MSAYKNRNILRAVFFIFSAALAASCTHTPVDTSAEYNRWLAYLHGKGGPQGYEQAVMLLRKAAEQGNSDAQSDLGFLYDEGWGVTQDHALAVKWYRKAADQGNVYAQITLGNKYDSGRDVPKNDTQAVQWYRKAARLGDDEAQYFLSTKYAKGDGVAKDPVQAKAWERKADEQKKKVFGIPESIRLSNNLRHLLIKFQLCRADSPLTSSTAGVCHPDLTPQP